LIRDFEGFSGAKLLY